MSTGSSRFSSREPGSVSCSQDSTRLLVGSTISLGVTHRARYSVGSIGSCSDADCKCQLCLSNCSAKGGHLSENGSELSTTFSDTSAYTSHDQNESDCSWNVVATELKRDENKTGHAVNGTPQSLSAQLKLTTGIFKGAVSDTILDEKKAKGSSHRKNPPLGGSSEESSLQAVPKFFSSEAIEPKLVNHRTMTDMFVAQPDVNVDQVSSSQLKKFYMSTNHDVSEITRKKSRALDTGITLLEASAKSTNNIEAPVTASKTAVRPETIFIKDFSSKHIFPVDGKVAMQYDKPSQNPDGYLNDVQSVVRNVLNANLPTALLDKVSNSCRPRTLHKGTKQVITLNEEKPKAHRSIHTLAKNPPDVGSERRNPSDTVQAVPVKNTGTVPNHQPSVEVTTPGNEVNTVMMRAVGFMLEHLPQYCYNPKSTRKAPKNKTDSAKRYVLASDVDEVFFPHYEDSVGLSLSQCPKKWCMTCTSEAQKAFAKQGQNVGTNDMLLDLDYLTTDSFMSFINAIRNSKGQCVKAVDTCINKQMLISTHNVVQREPEDSAFKGQQSLNPRAEPAEQKQLQCNPEDQYPKMNSSLMSLNEEDKETTRPPNNTPLIGEIRHGGIVLPMVYNFFQSAKQRCTIIYVPVADVSHAFPTLASTLGRPEELKAQQEALVSNMGVRRATREEARALMMYKAVSGKLDPRGVRANQSRNWSRCCTPDIQPREMRSVSDTRWRYLTSRSLLVRWNDLRKLLVKTTNRRRTKRVYHSKVKLEECVKSQGPACAGVRENERERTEISQPKEPIRSPHRKKTSAMTLLAGALGSSRTLGAKRSPPGRIQGKKRKRSFLNRPRRTRSRRRKGKSPPNKTYRTSTPVGTNSLMTTIGVDKSTPKTSVAGRKKIKQRNRQPDSKFSPKQGVPTAKKFSSSPSFGDQEEDVSKGLAKLNAEIQDMLAGTNKLQSKKDKRVTGSSTLMETSSGNSLSDEPHREALELSELSKKSLTQSEQNLKILKRLGNPTSNESVSKEEEGGAGDYKLKSRGTAKEIFIIDGSNCLDKSFIKSKLHRASNALRNPMYLESSRTCSLEHDRNDSESLVIVTDDSISKFLTTTQSRDTVLEKNSDTQTQDRQKKSNSEDTENVKTAEKSAFGATIASPCKKMKPGASKRNCKKAADKRSREDSKSYSLSCSDGRVARPKFNRNCSLKTKEMEADPIQEAQRRILAIIKAQHRTDTNTQKEHKKDEGTTRHSDGKSETAGVHFPYSFSKHDKDDQDRQSGYVYLEIPSIYLPYVLHDGFTCVSLRAARFFFPDCHCSLPHNVLRRTRLLDRKRIMCSFEEARLIHKRAFPYKLPSIISGEFIVRLDSLVALLGKLREEVKEAHRTKINTKGCYGGTV